MLSGFIWTVPLFVVTPLITAVLSSFLTKKALAVKVLVTICMICLLLLPLFTAVNTYYVFGAHPEVRSPLLPFDIGLNLGIAFNYTSLQMTLLLTFAVIASLIMGVAVAQQKKASGVYMALLMLVLASTGAIVLVDDLFDLFVFFEILTISQVGIVAAVGGERAHATAMKYLFLGAIAGTMLLLSVVFLLGSTSVLNISDLAEMIQALELMESPAILLGFALLLFAWTYGAGLPPFHAIKSEVYARSLPHAGALLQSTSKLVLIALGLILIRLFGWFAATWVAMLVLSLLAMIIGAAMAMVQTDYRRLIAYIAISQAGVVGIGMSFYQADLWGVTFGVFHGFNEIIIASALFISAGYLYLLKGNTDIRNFGGLLEKHKGFALLTVLLMLAVSGVPPFNTFQSEWRLISISFQQGYFPVGILMVIATVMTFYAMMKAFYGIFLKPSPAVYEARPPISISLSLVIALLLGLVFGLFPWLVTDPLHTGLTSILGGM